MNVVALIFGTACVVTATFASQGQKQRPFDPSRDPVPRWARERSMYDRMADRWP
jgi:hypothetical protein